MPDDSTRTAAPEDPDEVPTHTFGAGPNPAGGTVSHAPAHDAVPDVAITVDAVPDATPDIPGYEVLEELGRGGMGVVYKARNMKLNRIVALKMVLSGHADSGRTIRFLAEAEALASVKHPHVVQVYEFGESHRRPFIALEYLPGGSLTARLSKPMPAAAVVELLGKIARGVAAAHDGGMVHRDIKPGNVLFDAAGEPKVTDFGLAKRLTGGDLTATFAVLGTPHYMSPEQAKGDTKFVGPQADVWALGVILYEALTGVRPFAADDIQDVLNRVMTAEPVPPRKRVASLPRELELICLKCLAKPPYERYPTAKELADDLDRFTRGVPISVRPAGPIERGYKWVKRNRVLAGAMSAVVLALVLGSVVSLAFAMDARNEAARANGEAQRANGEAARADRERDDALTARNDLLRANDDLLKSQVQRYLATFSIGAPATPDAVREFGSRFNYSWDLLMQLPNGQTGELNSAEVEALWDLTANRGRQLSNQFPIEAVRTSMGTSRLAYRAEHLTHASIGLNAEARDEVQEHLANAIEAPDITDERRLDLLQLYATLGPPLPPRIQRQRRVYDRMVESLTKTTDGRIQFKLAEGVFRASNFMEPAVAMELLSTAVAVPVETASIPIVKPGVDVDSAQDFFIKGMVNCSRRMEPVAAAEKLRAALNIYGPGDQLLAAGIVEVCSRMDRSKSVLVLHDSMAQAGGKDAGAVEVLAEGLAQLAVDLESTKAADALLAAIVPMDNPAATLILAKQLGRIIDRMDRSQTVAICERAAAVIREKLTKGNPPDFTIALSLEQIVLRMEPARRQTFIEPTALNLLSVMKRSMDNRPNIHELYSAFIVMWKYLTPEKARTYCESAASIYLMAMSKVSPGALNEFNQVLLYLEKFAAITPHIDSQIIATLYREASRLLRHNFQPNYMSALLALTGRLDLDVAIETLLGPLNTIRIINGTTVSMDEIVAALLERLERLEPNQSAELLARAISRSGKADIKIRFTNALIGICAKVDSIQCTSALIEALKTTSDPLLLRKLSDSLNRAFQRMDATMVCGLVKPLLTRDSSEFTQQFAARFLRDATAHLEPAAAVAVLTPALDSCTGPSARNVLAKALVEALARLDDEAAAAALSTVAAAATAEPDLLCVYARGLIKVASRLKPDRAASIYQFSSQLLEAAAEKTADNIVHQALVSVLANVAAHLDPEIGIRTFTAAIKKATDPFRLTTYAYALLHLAKKLAPAKRGLACQAIVATLSESLVRQTEPRACAILATCLATVCAGTDPEKAAIACTAAAEKFVDVVTAGKDRDALLQAVDALSEVLERMAPSRALDILSQSMTKTNDSEVLRRLARAIARYARVADAVTARAVCRTAALHLLDALVRESKALLIMAYKPAYQPDILLDELIIEETTIRGLVFGLGDVLDNLDPIAAADILKDGLTRIDHAETRWRLAYGLLELTAGMDPARASVYQELAASKLTEELSRSGRDTDQDIQIVKVLNTLAKRMEPAKAAQVRKRVVSLLIEAAQRQFIVVESLDEIDDLEGESLVTIFSEAINRLGEPMMGEGIPTRLFSLPPVLVWGVQRMDAKAAEGFSESASKALLKSFNYTQNNQALLQELTRGLSTLIGRMERVKAVAMREAVVRELLNRMNFGEGAYTNFQGMRPDEIVVKNVRTWTAAFIQLTIGMATEQIAQLLTLTTDPFKLEVLVSSFAESIKEQGPNQAVDLYLLAMSRTGDLRSLMRLAHGLMYRCDELPSDRGFNLRVTAVSILLTALATSKSACIMDAFDFSESSTRSLQCLLFGIPHEEIERNAMMLAFVPGTIAAPGGLLPALPQIQVCFQPHARTLPPQALVELLKHPFCVGSGRRAVLDALEFTYARSFADQWEFVRYVRETNLLLDLTTPPPRPQAQNALRDTQLP